jgi:hypothetical protein
MNYKRLEIPDLVLCEPKIHDDNLYKTITKE